MSVPVPETSKGLWSFWLLVFATTLLVLLLGRVPVLRVAENWLYDLRLVAFSPAAPLSEDVLVVAIDESTLAQMPYRTPVDREFLGDLITALDSRGVRAIGVDLLLDQATEPAKDARLQTVLQDLGTPLVVASAGVRDGLSPAQAAFLEHYTEGLHRGVSLVERDRVDDTVRRVPLVDSSGRNTFVARVAEVAGIALPQTRILSLNYPPPQDGSRRVFPVHSAGDLATALPAAWVRDRIVLIGVDLPREDRYRTPLAALGTQGDEDMAGVLIHAHALQQLQNGDPGRALTWWLSALVVLAAAALGAISGARGNSAGGFAWTQVLNGGGLVGAVLAMSSLGGPLPPVLGPLLAFVVSSGVTIVRRWYVARKQSSFLRDAFAMYVAPAIVDQVLADPEKLRLSGDRRELTFLFTDIAGFTTLTEGMAADALVTILNEYLDGVSRIVTEHEGTIEKIVGDAVHTMFNAPLDQPDHAPRAVRCALAIDAFCRDFEQRMATRHVKFGMTRIGINTGQTVVGNMGGSARFNYSATGDAINVAARLESANRHLGTRVCVGGRTKALCAEQEFRPVGELMLVGKTSSIEVFEPVTRSMDAEQLAAYLDAYRRMRDKDPAAAQAFAALVARYPDDKLAAFHATRLADGAHGVRVVLGGK